MGGGAPQKLAINHFHPAEHNHFTEASEGKVAVTHPQAGSPGKSQGNGNEFHLILFGKGNYVTLLQFGEIFKD